MNSCCLFNFISSQPHFSLLTSFAPLNLTLSQLHFQLFPSVFSYCQSCDSAVNRRTQRSVYNREKQKQPRFISVFQLSVSLRYSVPVIVSHTNPDCDLLTSRTIAITPRSSIRVPFAAFGATATFLSNVSNRFPVISIAAR